MPEAPKCSLLERRPRPLRRACGADLRCSGIPRCAPPRPRADRGDEMASSRINHVSVNAKSLEASVAFYTELFGATPIPTPNFGFPVQWLGVGDTQLHLFERDVEPPTHHHFALTVEDL